MSEFPAGFAVEFDGQIFTPVGSRPHVTRDGREITQRSETPPNPSTVDPWRGNARKPYPEAGNRHVGLCGSVEN